MNAIATAPVVPQLLPFHAPPGFRPIPDPLDADLPSDEVVTTTRRGMIRVALVATEVATRFQRDGVAHDAMAWMLSPRDLFAGEAAVDACVARDACLRGVLMHGLSLGLDADPREIDELVEDVGEGVDGGCGAGGYSGGSVSAATVKENLKRAMWRAEALRQRMGNVPLTATSGFRSQACDRQVGGSGTGQHTYGNAIDLVGASFCPLAQNARYNGFGGIFGPGYPGHDDHVHVDIRAGRSWNAPTCGI